MKDLNEVINKIINKAVVGCDKYVHNDSTWLIFTDNKKWIIELTKDSTLWYNYDFFKNLFKVLSLDVVENQHYITKWVEETIINGVRNTIQSITQQRRIVEDTIENGVKETHSGCDLLVDDYIEDTIQNGVKEIHWVEYSNLRSVEDTIQNGVKYTCQTMNPKWKYVEDTIQTGVKYTSWHEPILLGTKVEDAIQNGVKEVKTDDSYRNYFKQNHKSEKVIENGIKETKKGGFNQHYDMFRTIENGVKHTEYGDWLDGDERFDDIIQNGIKETKSPGADGDLLSTLEWMESNNTVNIPKLIDDVIENGVKHTEAGWAQYNSVDDVIERGIKRTEGGMLFDETKVDRIISEGVKETKGGGYLGSIEMKGKMVHQLESPKQNNEVEDVIEHGVKLTNSSLQIDGSCVVEDVIQNGIKKTFDETHHRRREVVRTIRDGIKETHDDVYHHKGRVDDVIKNGVKQCIPSHTPLYNPMDFSVVYRENHRLDDVASVLEKGIKEVQPLPSQEGNMDWGNYYHRQEDRTKPHTKYVDDVITNGIKKTKAMDEWVNTDRILDFVISNGTSI